MFTRHGELDETVLVERLTEAWGLTIERIEHQPVGFGSHHWLAHERDRSWFVTVDDLDVHRRDDRDSRSAANERLSGALETAHRLQVAGHDWVIAPVPSRDTRVVEDLDDRFVCAMYPVVDGRSSSSGEYDDADERRSVVSLLVDLHRADPAEAFPAVSDDHVIPYRDALGSAMADVERPWTSGPFADRTGLLLAEHRDALRRVLTVHDDLVETVRRRCPAVVTHGEPHRANVIVTRDGPVLIDWESARRAPVERDLWSLLAADPSVRDFYEIRSGTKLDDDALRLYELRWDLVEIAEFVHLFRQPHERTADTETAWRGLVGHLDPTRWADLL